MLVPIDKNGGQDDPKNYRPVALLSPCWNAIEEGIALRLKEATPSSDLQLGFQRIIGTGNSSSWEYNWNCYGKESKTYSTARTVVGIHSGTKTAANDRSGGKAATEAVKIYLFESYC